MSRPCLMFAVLCAGCSAYKAPPSLAPRDATPVSAPAWRTWDAVVDLFATRDIPIRTIERTSGLVTTEESPVGAEGRDWANCGQLNGEPLPPDHAIYSVQVRGDWSHSSVQATVRWVNATSRTRTIECSTLHVWEQSFEADVKARAEIRALAAYGGPAADLAATPPAGPQEQAGPAATATRGDPTELSTPDTGTSPDTRPNNVLLSFEGFRRAVGDMERKNLLLGYRESALERLQVDLSATAFGEPTLEYQLTRLFLAYGATMNDDIQPTLVIRANGQQVGRYTRGGLRWDTASGERQ